MTRPLRRMLIVYNSAGATMIRRMLLALALLLPAAPSAWSRSLDEVLRAGELRVGVNPQLAPRALLNDKNEIDGFEPEVARALAEKLGVRLVLVPVGAPDRIPFVAADRIDIVMGAMSRTAERAKVIDFTVPLHSENYGIITTDGKAINGIADLNNEATTLVEVRGSTAIPYLQKLAPKAKLLLLDNYNDRDRALSQGRGDASFDGIDTAAFRLKVFPAVKWRIVATPEFGVTWSSLGVAKNNATLKDWLNVALYELHTSGMVEAAWQRWFLRPMDTKVPVTPYF